MSNTPAPVDICCIGHITHDKVINPGTVAEMPGGTAFYFSQAIRQMPVSYSLITALAPQHLPYAQTLQQAGVNVTVLPSRQTVFFENSYEGNPDNRTQRVPQQADAFKIADVQNIHARYIHLGPLLADDFEPGLIAHLAARAMLSLDVQGLLRRVVNTQVQAIDWVQKTEMLSYIHTLKTNEHELQVLTGQSDVAAGAKILAAMGVREVVVTLGSKGALIYANGEFSAIPAYKPRVFTDATGCGDTFMAGYLFKRASGCEVNDAGHFASAMAGLKAGISGAFTGTEQQVKAFAMR